MVPVKLVFFMFCTYLLFNFVTHVLLFCNQPFSVYTIVLPVVPCQIIIVSFPAFCSLFSCLDIWTLVFVAAAEYLSHTQKE